MRTKIAAQKRSLVVGVVIFTAIALAFLAAQIAHGQVVEPKVQPPQPAPKVQPIVPLTVQAKGGKLAVIDASKAKGDVLFDLDPLLEGVVEGKKLIVSIPKSDDAKSYKVSVTSWDDKTRDVVTISVAGDKITPPKPKPVDPIAQIQLDIASIKGRLDALEGAKPNPPTAGLLKHLTFVGGEQSAESRAVVNDAVFRAMLKSAGASVHVVSKGELASQSTGFIKAVNDAGGPPMIVCQDEGGRIIDHGPITTVQAATDLATKHIRR